MQPRNIFRAGALMAGLGIVAGAFGAHVIKGKVEPKDLETFEIAVRYQMYHAIGLIAVAGWFQALAGSMGSARTTKSAGIAITLLITGTLIFSGTLYGIVAGGPRWLGAITPIGGTLQIIGWVMLAVCGGKQEKNGQRVTSE